MNKSMTGVPPRIRVPHIKLQQVSMAVAAFGLVLAFQIMSEGVFLSPRNVTNALEQSITTALLALGILCVMVSGHIDLAVGSLLGLLGAVMAYLMESQGWGTGTAILMGSLLGTAIGAWHGLWVSRGKVPAFVVTLASLLALKGMLLVTTKGQTWSIEESMNATVLSLGQGYFPDFLPLVKGFHTVSFLLGLLACIWIFFRAKRKLWGLLLLPMTVAVSLHKGWPNVCLLCFLLAMGMDYVMERTVYGKNIIAIGSNVRAAFLAGIPVQRCTLIAFMVSGFLSSIAALVTLWRMGAATSSSGQNAELDAIAAAVIGGVSLSGGKGTVSGVVAGAFVIGALDNGLSLFNLEASYQYMVKGGILLVAVFFDILRKNSSTSGF